MPLPDIATTGSGGFDCLLVTRPQAEGEDLAARLDIVGLEIIVQPAHEFLQADLSAAELAELQAMAERESPPLLVFTSTRAVHFALLQVPAQLLARCRLAAIGPATALALQRAGMPNVIQPESGYSSEDLLQFLDTLAMPVSSAFIVAAAGGRKALLEGLRQRGATARMLLVYRREPAAVASGHQLQLEKSRRVLSVWTSADAMQQLSRGFSAAAWQKICAGEWLVVSQRLADAAEQFQAAAVHQAAGPGNAELAAAIREICHSG